MRIATFTVALALALGANAPAQDAQAGGDKLVDAYNKLKEAEGAKDAAGVLKWAAETSRIAREEEKTAASDEDGKRRLDYARQVDTYTEYSLSATAMQAADPKDTIALFEALTSQNPKSQYVAQATGAYLRALQQTKQGDKASAAAEKILENDPNNDDALLILADANQNHKRFAASAEDGEKLVAAMQAKPKPEGANDADWDKMKRTKLGLGYWYAGVSYASENKFAEADKALRAAVPSLPAGSEILGVGLFYLGLADYKLAKAGGSKTMLQDALKFSQQSAAIKSAMQTQAAANVRAIRSEVGPAKRH